MNRLFSLLALVLLASISNFALANDLYSDAEAFSTAKKKCIAPAEGSATVVRVVDGDTIKISSEGVQYSVRMMGIDTPETHYLGQTQGEWGDKAAAKLAQIIPPGTSIEIEFGSSVCDTYGRTLAHVFRGKLHVNAELAREGLAVNYCVYPSLKYCDSIGQMTKHAMENRQGLFSDPNYELPYDFRRRIRGSEQRSFVGSLYTKEVYTPGNQNRVPVEERVFFFGEQLVEPPFHVVE